MGGKKGRNLADHLQQGGGRCRPSPDGGAELAEEQDGRRLAGVISSLPVPGACCIGAAEGVLHGRAQGDRIDAAAAFEIGEKKTRSLGDTDGGVAMSGYEGARYRLSGRGSRNIRREETSGERERIEPQGALSRPHRLKPVPASLSLSPEIQATGDAPKRESPAQGPGFRSGENAGWPKPPRRLALFSSDGTRWLLVRSRILPLAVSEKCWEFFDRVGRCD